MNMKNGIATSFGALCTAHHLRNTTRTDNMNITTLLATNDSHSYNPTPSPLCHSLIENNHTLTIPKEHEPCEIHVRRFNNHQAFGIGVLSVAALVAVFLGYGCCTALCSILEKDPNHSSDSDRSRQIDVDA